jgi:ParB/RepB/Spo0J family partition protein
MDNQILAPVELIHANPYQPRQAEDPEAIAEIATSIKHNGLLQIPSARQVNGHYELAFGHTRLAAFKSNGESCMPLIILDLSDLQMFELGVAENVKRRDLNVIEQAQAMHRYMEEFGKSSVEAGEFFNISPETVRGTVRFLNLPKDVQGKLAQGEITQSTARTLLSLQKVAPAGVISETAGQFEKGKDKFGFEPTPDEVIEDVLESLDEVELMSPSYRTGKPRGGDSDAWLLDMKNFPNKLLPVLAAEDVAIALGVQENEEICSQIDAAYAGFAPLDDWELIYESLKSRLAPDLLEKIEHLINPPACTACPFYTVVEGAHYCGMKTCFDRKTYAWNREKLRAASADLKIEIYNRGTDGAEFRVLEDTWGTSESKHLALFKKRSKDLRLALAKDIDRKKSQSGYQGVPSGSVVMLVGKTLKTLLETNHQQRADKRSKEQAAARLSNMKAEKREALNREVSLYLKAIFDGLNMAALDTLWNAPGYGSNWPVNRYTVRGIEKPSRDDKLSVQEDYLRRIFALNLINKLGGYHGKTLSEYATSLGEEIKKWGIKLPKSIARLAAEMDTEIAAVSMETED